MVFLELIGLIHLNVQMQECYLRQEIGYEFIREPEPKVCAFTIHLLNLDEFSTYLKIVKAHELELFTKESFLSSTHILLSFKNICLTKFNLTINLDKSQRGTHMSRFIEVLHEMLCEKHYPLIFKP